MQREREREKEREREREKEREREREKKLANFIRISSFLRRDIILVIALLSFWESAFPYRTLIDQKHSYWFSAFLLVCGGG